MAPTFVDLCCVELFAGAGELGLEPPEDVEFEDAEPRGTIIDTLLMLGVN